MILKDLFMKNKINKKKLIFLGDTNSINIEIIVNSHSFLKNKLKYIVICNKREFINYIKKIKSNLKTNEILDPINFFEYKVNCINLFNVENKYKNKYKNLLNQLNISNQLSLNTGYDLITMPINKSVFKKHINFVGMTEYLGKINKKKTIMLMHGEKFSIIPLTTHINLKEVHINLFKSNLRKQIKYVMKLIEENKKKLTFRSIKFLCYNPHCGEENTIGSEDSLIAKFIKRKFKKISGPYPADSAFNNIKKNTLFISTYHDQALIPFKILNKKGINMTLGLNYRRMSPAHGTAKDIKYKNVSDNSSFVECMIN